MTFHNGMILSTFSISSHDFRFGEAQSKAMRAHAQSGQYHTIVESPQSKAMRAYAQSGQYRTIVESRVRLTNQTHNIYIYIFCNFETISNLCY